LITCKNWPQRRQFLAAALIEAIQNETAATSHITQVPDI
jgi:hypothetical protein